MNGVLTVGRTRINGWPGGILFSNVGIGHAAKDQGIFLHALKPNEDDEGLPEHAVTGEIIPARVDGRKTPELGTVTRSSAGRLVGPGMLSLFSLELSAKEDKARLDVKYTITFAGNPNTLIAAHGIRIPFAFSGNPRRTKIEAGTETRMMSEKWLVDQNGLWHLGWKLSDQKERWPLWRIGGIYQDAPGHYLIWKTNRADSAPLTVDEGEKCPGWIDVSDAGRGVTVVWKDMHRHAPCAVTVDYPAKMIVVYFHPPMSPARPAKDVGLVPGKQTTWKFTLHYHDDVVPATVKQELSREDYVELLRTLEEVKSWMIVANICEVPLEGDLDMRITRTLETGIQPSNLLRVLGNGWRMRGLCARMGIPHNPKDIEANVTAILDKYRNKPEQRTTPANPEPEKNN